MNTDKSERMEGQKSFLTASGSAGPVNVRLRHYFKNDSLSFRSFAFVSYQKYEGWNFNSGNYLFTNDTK